MLRFRTRPALAPLCALLYLTACAPTAVGSAPPTMTPQADVSPYYSSPTSGAQHTTSAGLPMTYLLTGAGNTLRTWLFANKPRTFYSLQAQDTQASASLQAQDGAILATFRPDNTDPWSC